MNRLDTSTSPDLIQRGPAPAPPPRGVRVVAAGGLGGLALFCDLSLHLFDPLDRSYCWWPLWRGAQWCPVRS